MNRRDFVKTAALSAASVTLSRTASAQNGDLNPIFAQIDKSHYQNVTRLQNWIRQPAIAAENRAMNEGCDYMMTLLRDAGFAQVTKIPSDGHPAAFGVLDAGAPRTLGVYFMYDVKQVDVAEWSSPPWDAALVNKTGLGKVLMGRGATNQKGPQATFLAALHAIRAAGRKLPVNLVFIAEGEEEIGSPHFTQIMGKPEVLAAFKRCSGVFMPFASQDTTGEVSINLGAKGIIELELVSTGERWGRGPKRDIHSSNKARVDSPSWHLVQALNTLVAADGSPAIDHFADKARALSEAEKKMIAVAAGRLNEAATKRAMGIDRWMNDATWQQSLEMLVSRPTVNIEGLVAGYTGPGGKTVLPHKAAAKLDLRLVPDMTAADALAALKAHLAKRGFGDIEVNMTGGYDPTSTPADSALVRSSVAVYKRLGIDPIMMPRLAGSWPGYVFTGGQLKLPAGHFGLGHGGGAHAPDEYYVIESTNPKIRGIDGATKSYVEFLYEYGRS